MKVQSFSRSVCHSVHSDEINSCQCFWPHRHMSRPMTKPTKWPMHPAKTQISQGIRPVWSESSLCAQWVAKDPSFLHADSKDSDQTERMPRPDLKLRRAHMPFCWFFHEVAHITNIVLCFFYINICCPEVGRVFKYLPRDPANVNAMNPAKVNAMNLANVYAVKEKCDHYSCIFVIYSTETKKCHRKWLTHCKCLNK